MLAVYESARAAVGNDFPVSLKLWMVGQIDGGTGLEESIVRAVRLAHAGVDAIEVGCGVMTTGSDSCHSYGAVDRRRALKDLLYFRAFSRPATEACW